MSQRGICYLFAYNLSFAERLAVSLFTLRRHWQGPVLVLADAVTEAMARRIAADTRGEVKVIEPVSGKNCQYVTKTLIPTWSPFDETLLLDADTTIHGDLTPLFDRPITLTQFSTWISTGRKISSRIKWMQGKSPMVDALIREQFNRDWPAINTGVIAWQRGCEWLVAWHELTKMAQGIFISDEICAQCLSGSPLEAAKGRVLDDRWNFSPMYGVAGQPVVIHSHGDKHWKKIEGRKLWEPELMATLEANVGGIQEWIGMYDKTTRSLRSLQKQPIMS